MWMRKSPDFKSPVGFARSFCAHLHCGSWVQRLQNLQGIKQALPSPKSPSNIPFLTLFQLPSAAKTEFWFSCCSRGKNFEAGDAELWQIPPEEQSIWIWYLIYPKNRPQKEKSTGGNKGLSIFLMSGFFDKWHQGKEATRAFGLRTPIKSRPH